MIIVGMYSLQRNPLNKPAQSCFVTYRPPCSIPTSLLLRVPARHRADDIKCWIATDDAVFSAVRSSALKENSLDLIQIHNSYRSTKKQNQLFTERL